MILMKDNINNQQEYLYLYIDDEMYYINEVEQDTNEDNIVVIELFEEQ